MSAALEDERAPLLESHSLSPRHARSRWLSRYSGPTLVVPVALICRVATLLPTTTTFFIIQQFICRQYYLAHDPTRIPPNGRMPDQLCSLSAIEENYAAFIAMVALMDGIGSLCGYAALGFLAARLGRRTAMVTLLGVGLCADAALLCSTVVASSLEFPLLLLWLVSASFSQVTLIGFITNVYLVDLVPENNRTSALSSLAGWSAFGSVLSFSAGGTITTRVGNNLVVYFVAGVLWLIALLYVWLVLPESFPEAKREELRIERAARQTNEAHLGRWRIFCHLPGVLEPLRHLKPVRDPRTGRRNWRLLICAANMFLVGVGGGYAAAALVTIITSLYHYTPAETGYTLTVLSGTSMLVLTVAIPMLVRVLRPLYIRAPHQTEGEVEQTTDRLDVHIAVASWAIEIAAYLTFGFTTTRATQFAAVIFIGCGPAYAPAVRSLVAASVEPLKQGEALGMIEMVFGLGLLFSPLVMGSILSATIASVPQTVFYVQAGIVSFAAAILLFVRDVDRYKTDM
ncbi:MFS general substrate transporter [Mycena crocata]|nr:MFS general substrate transporter [Mycena crocata]